MRQGDGRSGRRLARGEFGPAARVRVLGRAADAGQRAEDAAALVAHGFKAVKVRIARERLSKGVGVVSAIRDAVGDSLEILVDLNQWWRMAGDIEPGLGVAEPAA